MQTGRDAAIADMAVYELEVAAERANLRENRRGRIRGRVDPCPHAGTRRVRRERHSGVAGRRYHELLSPGTDGTRYRGREPACLEGSRRIGALVFDPQLLEAMARAETCRGQKRRASLAQSHRVFSFDERQPRLVTPHRPSLASQ